MGIYSMWIHMQTTSSPLKTKQERKIHVYIQWTQLTVSNVWSSLFYMILMSVIMSVMMLHCEDYKHLVFASTIFYYRLYKEINYNVLKLCSNAHVLEHPYFNKLSCTPPGYTCRTLCAWKSDLILRGMMCKLFIILKADKKESPQQRFSI